MFALVRIVVFSNCTVTGWTETEDTITRTMADQRDRDQGQGDDGRVHQSAAPSGGDIEGGHQNYGYREENMDPRLHHPTADYADERYSSLVSQ